MMRVLPVKPHDEPPLLLTTLVTQLGLINQMKVATITNDGTFPLHGVVRSYMQNKRVRS